MFAMAVLLVAGCRGRGEAGAGSEGSGEESGLHGAVIDPPEAMPSFPMTTAEGRSFDPGAERGKVVLVYLGYTNCPDVCPVTLTQWARARRALGADTARARFAFVTVDPARDTPAVMAAYVARFDSGIVAVTPTQAQVDSLQRVFHTASFREPVPPTDSAAKAAPAAHGGMAGHQAEAREQYLMAHSTRVYVIDPEGRWREALPSSASADTTVADVRKLLGDS